jgi:hypothetical protein
MALLAKIESKVTVAHTSELTSDKVNWHCKLTYVIIAILDQEGHSLACQILSASFDPKILRGVCNIVSQFPIGESSPGRIMYNCGSRQIMRGYCFKDGHSGKSRGHSDIANDKRSRMRVGSFAEKASGE